MYIRKIFLQLFFIYIYVCIFIICITHVFHVQFYCDEETNLYIVCLIRDREENYVSNFESVLLNLDTIETYGAQSRYYCTSIIDNVINCTALEICEIIQLYITINK